MKWVVIGIAGVVGIIAICFAAWHTLKLDTGRPEFITEYKSNFTRSCAAGAEQSISASGGTVDDKLKSMLHDLCACGADVSAEEFQKKEGLTMADMMNLQDDPAFKQKITEIMQACRQKLGMP
jgi:hypothetical protein